MQQFSFKRKTTTIREEKMPSRSEKHTDILQKHGEKCYSELSSFFPVTRYKICLDIRRGKPHEEKAYASLDTATITIVTDKVDKLNVHLVHEYFHVYIADLFDFPYLINEENYDVENLPCNLKKYTNVFHATVFEIRELAERLAIDYYAYKWLDHYARIGQLTSKFRPLVNCFFGIQFASYKEELNRIIDGKIKLYWYKYKRNEPFFGENDQIRFPVKFIYNENIKKWHSLFDLFITFISSLIYERTKEERLEKDSSSEKEIIETTLDSLIGLEGEERGGALSKGLSFLTDLVEKLRWELEDYQRANPRLVFKKFVETSLRELAGIECVVNRYTIKIKSLNLKKPFLKPLYRWYFKFLTCN